MWPVVDLVRSCDVIEGGNEGEWGKAEKGVEGPAGGFERGLGWREEAREIDGRYTRLCSGLTHRLAV